jgi:hypothetical protein
VVVKAGDTGRCRVRYDNEAKALLRRNFSALAPLDRALTLLRDPALVARARAMLTDEWNPGAAGGFNERPSIDTLVPEQQARVGEAGLVPAQQVAEQIRQEVDVREREGLRLATNLRRAVKGSAR